MARATRYQCVPADWDYLQRSFSSAPLADLLTHLEPTLSRRRFPSLAESSASNLFREQVTELLACSPGIESRNCFHDSADNLFYLLSPKRRAQHPGERVQWQQDDWVALAIYGARALPSTDRANRDLVRYSDPAHVIESHELLSCVTTTDLEEYFDPFAMGYVLARTWSDDMVRDHRYLLKRCFEDVKAVYGAAADHDEGLLVVTDLS